MDMDEMTTEQIGLLNKLSGDDIRIIKLTRIWAIGVVTLLSILIVSITAAHISDNLQTKHGILTTTTQQQVVYPKGD